MAKCRIQKYDPDITEPPFEFIDLGEFECHKPEDDRLGEQFALILSRECALQGFAFKFYSSSSDDNYDFDVVVWS